MVVIGREDGAYTAVTDDGSASGDSIIRKAIRRTAVWPRGRAHAAATDGSAARTTINAQPT